VRHIVLIAAVLLSIGSAEAAARRGGHFVGGYGSHYRGGHEVGGRTTHHPIRALLRRL